MPDLTELLARCEGLQQKCDALAEQLEQAECRLAFLENTGAEADGYGWECDHARRYYMVRTGDPDDYEECQVCRAEEAEAGRDALAERVVALEKVLECVPGLAGCWQRCNIRERICDTSLPWHIRRVIDAAILE